ncbi:tryptophan 2,3-dioxygenase [Nocardia wallacei]|uniref:tryptophan 2,3-dioxygenase n=1 Tax=Nocardia wallacei TaxID=480035 RepID=UPI0024564ABA|nr:tryptophan 2,3-dioxygenase family protein [Nocardia wallacei]
MTEPPDRPRTCPVAGGVQSPPAPGYVTYARMDRLHELAEPRTDSAQELSFILLSHVKELLFRMVYVDVDQARDRLRAGDADQACRALERTVRSQRILVTTWEGINAISADEFLAFRDVLGDASGVQSFMYRTLEFALGNKSPAMVRTASAQAGRYPDLRAELAAPSLYDETLRFLARRGHAVPDTLCARDFREQYAAHPAVEDVWLRIYRAPRSYPDEYRVAELLTEVAFQFSHWRATHLLVVERKLGRKPGTGGTDGVDWLRAVNEHRFFPELWSMRTRL